MDLTIFRSVSDELRANNGSGNALPILSPQSSEKDFDRVLVLNNKENTDLNARLKDHSEDASAKIVIEDDPADSKDI